MPAEVEFSEMTFVNATSSNNEIAEKQNPRGFKSFVDMTVTLDMLL